VTEAKPSASEAAKLVAGDPRNNHAARRDWEALMRPARAAARRLAASGKILVTNTPSSRSCQPQKANPSSPAMTNSQSKKFISPKTSAKLHVKPETT